MTLLLISFLPILVLLVWGNKLNETARSLLKLASLPFFVLVAFYSLLIALGIILAFIIYIKFIMPRMFAKHANEINHIEWRE